MSLYYTNNFNKFDAGSFPDKKNFTVYYCIISYIILIIFHFSSSFLHGCSSKIKLIIYNSIYKKKDKMLKFLNLKLLQEFCQTYISLTCL